ncbi:MAG: nucleotidyltransferase family protein [Halobacillus sp.]|uniref:nucleotidyltransferase family protein n=1 Tax=Halobacillus sp. TaxID=56800 RepID=UPI003BB09B89
MKINNEEDVIQSIKEDEWMMDILKAVKTLNLPDWWICAGFVRSKIWDVIHNYNWRTPLPDIDVIYFDTNNVCEAEEEKIEENLKTIITSIPWSVKNQARMHTKSGMTPYSSSVDGISNFPETVTSLGVKINENDDVILTAPWGVDDVVNLEVRPTPVYDTKERREFYIHRVITKNWSEKWDRLKVYGIPTSK